MKKIALFLSLLIPAMMFGQHNLDLVPDVPSTIKVAIPAYNERIPAAIVSMTFEFNSTTEIMTVKMNSDGMASPNYSKVWLPQHEIVYSEMGNYMKSRGMRLRKLQSFVDQENFLNLPSKPIMASISPSGMTFDGNYDLRIPPKRRIKKDLERQMIPLDGLKELFLKFKVHPNTKDVVLTLRNPMPISLKGDKVAFMADDVVININIDRCKLTAEVLTTVKEYLGFFEIGEVRLSEMKRTNRSLMGKVAAILVEQYEEIDTKRFENTGCADIDETYEDLEECLTRIREYLNVTPPPPPPQECDAKSLNAEIKSTTSKLNSLVNEWSIASSASAKAEKKAAFDSLVKSFDAQLNGLNSNCKSKIDKKLMKNYEFVKQLVQ